MMSNIWVSKQITQQWKLLILASKSVYNALSLASIRLWRRWIAPCSNSLRSLISQFSEWHSLLHTSEMKIGIIGYSGNLLQSVFLPSLSVHGRVERLPPVLIMTPVIPIPIAPFNPLRLRTPYSIVKFIFF